MTCRMYGPVKLSNISIHSAGVVACSSKRVLILHVLPLAVCTAFWSGWFTLSKQMFASFFVYVSQT